MNKQKIIDYIDTRIQYYTGGESMKSMSESVCDERIIAALVHLKNEISKPARNTRKFEENEQVKVVKGIHKNCVGKFKRYQREGGYSTGNVVVFVSTPNGDIERLIKPSSYFGKL